MIAAIPTEYKGIKMRSKLEASFAKSLDAYRIEWVYEAEGFDIEGTWYLPDFWLPKFQSFVEVKGVLDDSIAKPRKLSGRVGHRRVFLASPSDVQTWERGERPQLLQLAEHECWDRRCVLAKCKTCGHIDIAAWPHCYRVYLAGKVSGRDDWRLHLVPGLRGAFAEQTDWPDLEIGRAIEGAHIYTGPFFRAGQHDVRIPDVEWDGGDANSHMMDRSGREGHDGTSGIRGDVFESCLKAIRDSDFVFAWISDSTAFGTLVEIGYALGRGKTVFLAGDVPDEMWFAQFAAVNIETDRLGNRITDVREAFQRAVEIMRQR